jgi:hypothetical protein
MFWINILYAKQCWNYKTLFYPYSGFFVLHFTTFFFHFFTSFYILNMLKYIYWFVLTQTYMRQQHGLPKIWDGFEHVNGGKWNATNGKSIEIWVWDNEMNISLVYVFNNLTSCQEISIFDARELWFVKQVVALSDVEPWKLIVSNSSFDFILKKS